MFMARPAIQGSPGTKSSQTPRDEDCATVVRRALARGRVPGLAIGILQHGAAPSAWTDGFGVANKLTGELVRLDTVFRIASITKLFTATLALRLVDEGALALDAPIAAYLPDLQLADAQASLSITLRHLLAHQSGLDGAFTEDHGIGEDALARAVARFHTLRQITAPGTVWNYCNAGYHLIGAIIARVSGASFEQAMTDRVFTPLGLRHTTWLAANVPVSLMATGHSAPGRHGHRPAPLPLDYPRNRNPAGGILSCVGDLLRFAAMHLDDGAVNGVRMLEASAVRSMQMPQVLAAGDAQAYGLGWALRTVAGEPVIGHGGDTNGFRTLLTLVPHRGFALALLANGVGGGPALRAIEAWALGHYCGLRAARSSSLAAALRWARWRVRLARYKAAWRRAHG